MEERVNQAAEAAQQAELKKIDQRIAQVTAELKQEHLKALEAERGRSADAVEAEKKKMRKLVKALAIREKKLLAKAEQEKQKQSSSYGSTSTETTQVSVVPKTQPNKPRSTPTTRGPI